MLSRTYTIIGWFFYASFWMFFLTTSTPIATKPMEHIHGYTRDIEFDYFAWIGDASWIKLQQAALGSPHYMDRSTRKHVVAEFLRLTERIFDVENSLLRLYADPSVVDPEESSRALQEELAALLKRQEQIAPMAESILEEQISVVLAEAGLAAGGQPLPQPLYHISPLPLMLIISPRDEIRQEAGIGLLAELPVNKGDALENRILSEQDLSALIVPVGGIGIYPTMGMRTTNLPWMVDTIAHEWMHNYLTWHPLGANYGTTPALRTINETVASIVGGEIGQAVIEKYYPELLAVSPSDLNLILANEQFLSPNPDPPSFEYRAEMHRTRLRVDELLAVGEVDAAEAYMEHRRQVFWDNGYLVRKINQAYFAFYGAYADVPGGAAGKDPVGPAVRALREQSDSLADFVHQIMWVDSFEELQEMVE